ncbi:MAG: class I SAM-dependent methyltransferase, partial [Aeoliella sp.]
PLDASFRDPSGFLFRDDEGVLLRQVNNRYQSEFDAFSQSGLYSALVKDGLLVEHQSVDRSKALTDEAYQVIKPTVIPFISYPYEWAFSALKDAALLTLSIQAMALKHEMSLKDASAYNVQFVGCKPIFIDTLSFEHYPQGKPWIAYGQFCRHFLAPLLLMAHSSVDIGRLSELFIDGIPLDLTSKLLPLRTKFSLGTQLHLHMHAKMVRKHESTASEKKVRVGNLPKKKLLLLLDNLKSLISSLRWQPTGTQWNDYYEDNTYSDESADNKRELVSQFLQKISPATAWDLGANTGVYSKLAVDHGAYCCAWDIDPACVERGYLNGKKRGEDRMLPLRIDLANPSPALGWAHQERAAFAERGSVDVVMALALIHHLSIANNVPLENVARFFHKLGRHLIIEWVPKFDVQVQRLLQSREDIFDHYEQASFEAAFERFYEIDESLPVGNDGRVLYRMTGKN